MGYVGIRLSVCLSVCPTIKLASQTAMEKWPDACAEWVSTGYDAQGTLVENPATLT